jgi:hypothetical protein
MQGLCKLNPLQLSGSFVVQVLCSVADCTLNLPRGCSLQFSAFVCLELTSSLQQSQRCSQLLSQLSRHPLLTLNVAGSA